jgi:hypothetical protein
MLAGGLFFDAFAKTRRMATPSFLDEQEIYDHKDNQYSPPDEDH